MHDSNQRVTKHFLLTECEQQYIFPALSGAIGIIFITSQQNVPPDFFYISCKKQNGSNHEQNEYNLLNVEHIGLITHLR